MKNFKDKGYVVGAGFIGYLPNGDEQLFPTEKEYYEYIEDEDAE